MWDSLLDNPGMRAVWWIGQNILRASPKSESLPIQSSFLLPLLLQIPDIHHGLRLSLPTSVPSPLYLSWPWPSIHLLHFCVLASASWRTWTDMHSTFLSIIWVSKFSGVYLYSLLKLYPLLQFHCHCPKSGCPSSIAQELALKIVRYQTWIPVQVSH